MKKTVLICCVAALLAACASSGPKGLQSGADKDAHGCIASAGYVWSHLQAKCIRLWEEGIALMPVKKEATVFAAYVILSVDGTKAELFLADDGDSVPLQRSFTQEGPRWMSQEGTYLLQRTPLKWSLYRSGRLIYTADNPTEAKKDAKSKR